MRRRYAPKGLKGRLDEMWRKLLALWFCWVAASLAPLVTGTASAQTADTAILGTVLDSSGAAVPGATFEIAQPATGLTRTVLSNSSGDYELRYLVPGTYDVRVSTTGFAAQRRTG